MKKENIYSIIVYLLMIGLALFIGLGIIKPVFENNAAVPMNQYGFAILSVIIGVIVNAILLEVGHVLGALLGKYKIVSVNIFGFSLNFQDKSKKFELKNFEGLTGETKFAPKSNLANPKYAIIIPLVLYLLELGLAILSYALITKDNNLDLVWLSIGSIIVASIGGMMTLYNILPFRLDVETDGYRLTLFSKKINIDAFNAFRLLELTDNLEELSPIEEITDYTAVVNILSTYPLIKKQEYTQAEEVLDLILKQNDKISTSVYSRAYAHLFFIKALTSSLDELKSFHSEMPSELNKYFASDLSTHSLRAYLLTCGLIEESEREVVYALEKSNKAMKHIALELVQTEEELTKQALNKVLEHQPTWEIK